MCFHILPQLAFLLLLRLSLTTLASMWRGPGFPGIPTHLCFQAAYSLSQPSLESHNTSEQISTNVNYKKTSSNSLSSLSTLPPCILLPVKISCWILSLKGLRLGFIGPSPACSPRKLSFYGPCYLVISMHLRQHPGRLRPHLPQDPQEWEKGAYTYSWV